MQPFHALAVLVEWPDWVHTFLLKFCQNLSAMLEYLNRKHGKRLHLPNFCGRCDFQLIAKNRTSEYFSVRWAVCTLVAINTKTYFRKIFEGIRTQNRILFYSTSPKFLIYPGKSATILSTLVFNESHG